MPVVELILGESLEKGKEKKSVEKESNIATFLEKLNTCDHKKK